MANPTKFSQPAVNPAFMSRRFPKTAVGNAAASEFVAEKQAEGFKTQTTTAFGGRDMKTRQAVKVTVVHVFRTAEQTRQMQEEAHARWVARESGQQASA